jgi:hypothetical protein
MLKTLYSDFRWSFIVAIACLALAYIWGNRWAEGPLAATWVAVVLGFMEVTLSFDNAVVNAAVLRDMDEKWRKLFLTVGIIIAVFGMRLVFPIAIVAVTTGMGWIEVTQMALQNPDEYSHHLHANHTAIASFGGIFLLLVFFSFLFDDSRNSTGSAGSRSAWPASASWTPSASSRRSSRSGPCSACCRCRPPIV